jgi:pseudaminic acid cytidylyltransferase
LANLAIITARGGSKRIPRKNIRDFLGKPIIAYSIEAALHSGIFDEVMVSTDDEEIASIAKIYGAKVPFLRSAENANDFAGTYEVIEEVLNSYFELDKSFDYACCIYPTAPFVNAIRFTESFELLKGKQLDVVFPICKYSFPIQRALHLNNGKVEMIQPENRTKRSQDLPSVYHDAGQFYFFETKKLLANKKLFTENTGAIVLDEMEVQDIDNETDWKIAELKYTLLSTSLRK